MGNDKEVENGLAVETDVRLFSWQLGAGYAIFLNDHVAIEPLISFRSDRFTFLGNNGADDVTDRSSGLLAGIGFNIFLH